MRFVFGLNIQKRSLSWKYAFRSFCHSSGNEKFVMRRVGVGHYRALTVTFELVLSRSRKLLWNFLPISELNGTVYVYGKDGKYDLERKSFAPHHEIVG